MAFPGGSLEGYWAKAQLQTYKHFIFIADKTALPAVGAGPFAPERAEAGNERKILASPQDLLELNPGNWMERTRAEACA